MIAAWRKGWVAVVRAAFLRKGGRVVVVLSSAHILHVLEVLQRGVVGEPLGHVDTHNWMGAELIGPKAHRLTQIPRANGPVFRARHRVPAVSRKLYPGHWKVIVEVGVGRG